MAGGYCIGQRSVKVGHSWNHDFDTLVIFSFFVIFILERVHK